MHTTYNKLLLICTLSLGLAGCFGPTSEKYSKALDSWLGTPISEYIKANQEWLAKNSEPEKIYMLNNGMKAYEYNHRYISVEGGQYYSEVIQVGQQPVPHQGRIIGVAPIYQTVWHQAPYYEVERHCKTIFEVDNQGIIQAWTWEGNDCVKK